MPAHSYGAAHTPDAADDPRALAATLRLRRVTTPALLHGRVRRGALAGGEGGSLDPAPALPTPLRPFSPRRPRPVR